MVLDVFAVWCYHEVLSSWSSHRNGGLWCEQFYLTSLEPRRERDYKTLWDWPETVSPATVQRAIGRSAQIIWQSGTACPSLDWSLNTKVHVLEVPSDTSLNPELPLIWLIKAVCVRLVVTKCFLHFLSRNALQSPVHAPCTIKNPSRIGHFARQRWRHHAATSVMLTFMELLW